MAAQRMWNAMAFLAEVVKKIGGTGKKNSIPHVFFFIYPFYGKCRGEKPPVFRLPAKKVTIMKKITTSCLLCTLTFMTLYNKYEHKIN
jgi:hypothetical protein